MVKCIYIVQTEAGFPRNYDSISDKSVLLSWKAKTPDTTIFMPNSTWTSGRNAAIHHLKEKGEDFEYVIFLDDDIYFKNLTQEVGFKRFEAFLTEHKPAIGLPRCFDYNATKTQISGLPEDINRQGLEDLSLDYQAVDWFDGCFNAIRRDAADIILPYDQQYDAHSWFTSQFILILRANFYFKNEIIQCNRLQIMNGSIEHEIRYKYPRGVRCFPDAYQKFLSEKNICEIQMSRKPSNL